MAREESQVLALQLGRIRAQRDRYAAAPEGSFAASANQPYQVGTQKYYSPSEAKAATVADYDRQIDEVEAQIRARKEYESGAGYAREQSEFGRGFGEEQAAKAGASQDRAIDYGNQQGKPYDPFRNRPTVRITERGSYLTEQPLITATAKRTSSPYYTQQGIIPTSGTKTTEQLLLERPKDVVLGSRSIPQEGLFTPLPLPERIKVEAISGANFLIEPFQPVLRQPGRIPEAFLTLTPAGALTLGVKEQQRRLGYAGGALAAGLVETPINLGQELFAGKTGSIGRTTAFIGSLLAPEAPRLGSAIKVRLAPLANEIKLVGQETGRVAYYELTSGKPAFDLGSIKSNSLRLGGKTTSLPEFQFFGNIKLRAPKEVPADFEFLGTRNLPAEKPPAVEGVTFTKLGLPTKELKPKHEGVTFLQLGKPELEIVKPKLQDGTTFTKITNPNPVLKEEIVLPPANRLPSPIAIKLGGVAADLIGKSPLAKRIVLGFGEKIALKYGGQNVGKQVRVGKPFDLSPDLGAGTVSVSQVRTSQTLNLKGGTSLKLLPRPSVPQVSLTRTRTETGYELESPFGLATLSLLRTRGVTVQGRKTALDLGTSFRRSPQIQLVKSGSKIRFENEVTQNILPKGEVRLTAGLKVSEKELNLNKVSQKSALRNANVLRTAFRARTSLKTPYAEEFITRPSSPRLSSRSDLFEGKRKKRLSIAQESKNLSGRRGIVSDFFTRFTQQLGGKSVKAPSPTAKNIRDFERGINKGQQVFPTAAIKAGKTHYPSLKLRGR